MADPTVPMMEVGAPPPWVAGAGADVFVATSREKEISGLKAIYIGYI
jgi:hypothetical protein